MSPNLNPEDLNLAKSRTFSYGFKFFITLSIISFFFKGIIIILKPKLEFF